MSPAWFRRPDGVLVAAQHRDEAALFKTSGYEPIAAEKAEAEIAAGRQQQLNTERSEAESARREAEIAAERQRKAEDRRAAARATIADGLTPPPGTARQQRATRPRTPRKPAAG